MKCTVTTGWRWLSSGMLRGVAPDYILEGSHLHGRSHANLKSQQWSFLLWHFLQSLLFKEFTQYPTLKSLSVYLQISQNRLLITYLIIIHDNVSILLYRLRRRNSDIRQPKKTTILENTPHFLYRNQSVSSVQGKMTVYSGACYQ
jgi:hypothetical protein